MTLLIAPPPRAAAEENDPDFPDADTDHGAADVTVLEDDRGPADRLRADAAAVRLHVNWPGLRRTLSAEQKEDAASPFDADSGSLSASKKLLDTKHPALRAAAKVRHAAVSHWKSSSLPYPESGVRLLPRADLPAFEVRLTTLRGELADAAADVDRHRDELVSRARRRLGDLFDPADYPAQPRPAVRAVVGPAGRRAAGLPAAAIPSALRTGVLPRAAAVRAGGGTGRTGVRSGTRPAGRAPEGTPPPAAKAAGRGCSATAPWRT